MRHCRDCNHFGLTVIATGVCVKKNIPRDYHTALPCKDFVQNPRLIKGKVQTTLEDYK